VSPRAAPLWLAALCVVGGCGYRTGLVLPGGQGTSVAVSIFDNDSKLRDLEAPLNAAIALSAERLLDARLTAPERADYVVRGRILSYEKRGGIRSEDNMLLETGVIIVVEAQLVRGRARVPDAEVSATETEAEAETKAEPGAEPGPLARTRATATAGFRLDEPDGERVARDRCLRNLADRIVLDLFAPLAYEPPVTPGPPAQNPP
jgi:hypothetical protein